ncbi:MAG: PHP domain-containing protein [Candidatus Aenigmarchaeota archaeon]|nr:PHP domain-containing protein [Candidatus Aenigmarchaeota archaeon]
MINADFHIHTCLSKCSVLKPNEIVELALKKKLDVIAITDHNNIKGAEIVKKIAKNKILVIKGVEIKTYEGEILILNPSKVYKGNLIEVCEEAIKDNAIIIAPHPFDLMRNSIRDNIITISKYLSAIEIFNSRAIFQMFNKKAMETAKKLKIPGIVGSDSHTKYEIGRVKNIFDCEKKEEEIFEKLRRGEFKIFYRKSPAWVHTVAKFSKFIKI